MLTLKESMAQCPCEDPSARAPQGWFWDVTAQHICWGQMGLSAPSPSANGNHDFMILKENST